MPNNEYAKWKKVAWRFGRVFIGAALVSLAANWGSVESVADVWPLFVLPALIAGVNALFKAVREYLASGNYRSLLHKLPL